MSSLRMRLATTLAINLAATAIAETTRPASSLFGDSIYQDDEEGVALKGWSGTGGDGYTAAPTVSSTTKRTTTTSSSSYGGSSGGSTYIYSSNSGRRHYDDDSSSGTGSYVGAFVGFLILCALVVYFRRNKTTTTYAPRTHHTTTVTEEVTTTVQTPNPAGPQGYGASNQGYGQSGAVFSNMLDEMETKCSLGGGQGPRCPQNYSLDGAYIEAGNRCRTACTWSADFPLTLQAMNSIVFTGEGFDYAENAKIYIHKGVFDPRSRTVLWKESASPDSYSKGNLTMNRGTVAFDCTGAPMSINGEFATNNGAKGQLSLNFQKFAQV